MKRKIKTASEDLGLFSRLVKVQHEYRPCAFERMYIKLSTTYNCFQQMHGEWLNFVRRRIRGVAREYKDPAKHIDKLMAMYDTAEHYLSCAKDMFYNEKWTEDMAMRFIRLYREFGEPDRGAYTADCAGLATEWVVKDGIRPGVVIYSPESHHGDDMPVWERGYFPGRVWAYQWQDLDIMQNLTEAGYPVHITVFSGRTCIDWRKYPAGLAPNMAERMLDGSLRYKKRYLPKWHYTRATAQVVDNPLTRKQAIARGLIPGKENPTLSTQL